MKKLFTALALSTVMAAPVLADSIYIDNGMANNDGSLDKAAGDTTTGWKDSLKLTYTSESTVTDANNDGVFSIGDTISSEGGLAVGGFNENLITELLASEVFGTGPSDNGYGDNWLLSFAFTGFEGYFNGFDFVYTSGTIQFFYLDALNQGGVRLFDLVLGGPNVSTPGNQVYSGTVTNFGTDSINGVDAGDVFNIKYGNDALSFQEYNEQMPMDVFFRIDQNTDTRSDVLADINNQFNGVAGASADITVSHDGSLEFAVPEPTSLAILGLGLIGLAGASRRKA